MNYYNNDILEKEIKDFIEDKGVTVHYSGGGNWHYFYKGFLINSDNYEIEHKLEKYKLDTQCYFGYWNGEKQFGFHQTFQEGVELLEMLDIKELEIF
jgi:hypothetical protein